MNVDSGGEDQEENIPDRKNPNVSKRHTDNLFGFLQVEATTHHDSIQELKEMRDKIIKNIPNESMTDEGMSLNETTKEILHNIMDIDPSEICDEDDLPPDIQNSPLVKLEEIQSSMELSEMISDIQRQFDGSQYEIERSTSEILVPDRISRQHLSYFAMVSAIIEQRSALLIKEILITSEFREDENVSRFVEEKMSQNRRDRLLHNCGIVDGPLLSDMQKIRGKRNRLVHRAHERRYVEPKKFANVTKTAFQVANELDNILMSFLRDRYAKE